MRDVLSRPFRPSWERPNVPHVPKLNVPRPVERALQNRALEIARRIIKTGVKFTGRNPYVRVLKWVLDELIDWFIRRFVAKDRFESSWTLRATGPLPPQGALLPTLYGGANAVWVERVNDGLANQASPAGATNDPTNRTAMFENWNTHSTPTQPSFPRFYTYKYWDRTITNVRTPVYMDYTKERIKDGPVVLRKPPPKKVIPYLKPDWPAVIDERLPDPGREQEPDPPAVADNLPPGKEFIVDFGPKVLPNPRMRFLPPNYRHAPPPREKEKKFQGVGQTPQTIFRILSRFKEELSELDDLLDIFLDALPKEVQDSVAKRNGRRSPDAKAKTIYDNWEKIDWAKFAEEWVKNWLEDKAVGAAIAASDKAAKARGETNTIGSRGSWLHNAVGGARFPR